MSVSKGTENTLFVCECELDTSEMENSHLVAVTLIFDQSTHCVWTLFFVSLMQNFYSWKEIRSDNEGDTVFPVYDHYEAKLLFSK
jgi:hypothetical protein